MKNKNIIYVLLVGILFLSACSSLPKDFDGKQIEKPKYKVTLSDDKKAILIAGKFDQGIYHHVNQIYKLHKSTVEALVYKSYGGLLNESDQLYKLAFKNRLNTYAFDFCMSACTSAYIGGSTRFAQRGTEFGFHQFGTTYTGGVQGGMKQRLIAEEYKTRGKYRKQGVSKEFIDEMFVAKNSGMWKPLQNILVKANVIDTLVRKKEMPYFNFQDKSLYPKKWY